MGTLLETLLLCAGWWDESERASKETGDILYACYERNMVERPLLAKQALEDCNRAYERMAHAHDEAARLRERASKLASVQGVA